MCTKSLSAVKLLLPRRNWLNWSVSCQTWCKLCLAPRPALVNYPVEKCVLLRVHRLKVEAGLPEPLCGRIISLMHSWATQPFVSAAMSRSSPGHELHKFISDSVCRGQWNRRRPAEAKTLDRSSPVQRRKLYPQLWSKRFRCWCQSEVHRSSKPVRVASECFTTCHSRRAETSSEAKLLHTLLLSV